MLVETLRPLHTAKGQLYSTMEAIQFLVLSIGICYSSGNLFRAITQNLSLLML
jgi:hypothetical protein